MIPEQPMDALLRCPVARRTALGGVGAAVLAAGLVRGGGEARADHYGNYDTVEAYEKAWAAVDTSVPDNEAGGLAWNMSYLLLSLVRMYEATADTRYLDRFVERADAVWRRTDRARGVREHDGRSGPVWRAGGNYTAAAAVVPDAQGRPLFEIRYASSAPTSAAVAVTRAGDGTFDLTLTHPSVPTQVVTGLSLDPSSPDFVVTRINRGVYHPNRRWTAQALAASGTPVVGSHRMAQRYYAFAVHTGMVTYPMALFARIVLERGLAPYAAAARRYVALTRAAVAHHDHEVAWRIMPDGSRGAVYVWPTGAPVPFDGLIQPHNQSQGLGMTMSELYRIRRDGRYAELVVGLARSWISTLERSGGAWSWRYWPTYGELFSGYADTGRSTYTPWYGPATQVEDISHAAITVEFAAAARGAGLGIDDAVLRELANTYLTNVARDAGSVANRVDGSQVAALSVAAQAGRWLALDAVEPRIADHVRGLYRALHLPPEVSSRLAGVAYLVWAGHDGWRA